MRILTNYSITILLLGPLYACQTPKLNIVSDPPEAEVFLFDSRSASYKNVGKTPIDIRESQDARDVISANDVLAISIEKVGFVIEHVFIDKENSADINLSLKLKKMSVWVEKEKKQADDRELDAVVREIQRIISASKKQDYVLAHSGVLSLISRYPEAPVLWDMKGSIERLRNQSDEAIKSYKKSLSLGSNDPETQAALKSLAEGLP
jgi:hypothetical protein